MHTFEILLILVAITDGMTRIILADRRPIWVGAFPMFAFLFAIIHVAGEGSRWQMVPIYIVVLSTFGAALIRAFRTGDVVLDGSGLSRGTGVLIIALAVISLTAGTAFPVFELPPPAGDYVVGVREVSLQNTMTARVYFPSDGPVGTRSNLGMSDLEEYRTYLETAYGLPQLVLSHLTRVKTHAYPDTELSRELPRYRVLLVQPERDRPSARITGLVEELASHGFVVIVTSSTAASETEGSPIDLERVADQLESIDPNGPAAWLADRLDLGRIGIFGFDTAGQTVVEACEGGTFRACAAIGASVSPESSGAPFLYLRPEETEAVALSDVKATTYITSVRGLRSDNFGDDAFVSPLMPALGDFGSIDPDRASHITSVYLGAFFNKHLTRGTVEPVLDAPSPDYPEVSIQIHDSED
jgi:hypothetical protein